MLGGVRKTGRVCLAQGLIVLTLIVLTMAATVQADGYYVYRAEDGTPWYTDRRMPTDQYELVATIGRPTASAACRGITPVILEERARLHKPIIAQYAKLYGVNELLIKAIIRVESCFDRHAISRVGAKGLMQLMPATARQLGVYNVFNAKDNIRGGTRYFHNMMQRFDNNIELALAAYNAGPKAVEKYHGIPPYKETESYVRHVMDYYGQYAGP